MKPWGLEEWVRQSLIDGYAAGEKVEALAAEFGVSPSYVSVLAKRRGLAHRMIKKVEHSSGATLPIEAKAQ